MVEMMSEFSMVSSINCRKSFLRQFIFTSASFKASIARADIFLVMLTKTSNSRPNTCRITILRIGDEINYP